jgi:hypothetical protein
VPNAVKAAVEKWPEIRESVDKVAEGRPPPPPTLHPPQAVRS